MGAAALGLTLLCASAEENLLRQWQSKDGQHTHKVGDKTKVTIMRKAKRVDLSIDLGKEPSNDVIKVPEIMLENFRKGSIESVDLKTSGAGIESILENPDIPDDFKASIRAMQKKLKEFEKKTD